MNKKLILSLAIVLLLGFLLFKNLQKGKTTSEISVSEDICKEFPQKFIEESVGVKIIKISSFEMKTTKACNYFVKETAFLSIKSENLNVEKQKQGNKYLGFSIKTDNRIQTEHFIVVQKDGQIKKIYLVINPDKYVSVERNSVLTTDNEGMMKFAISVVEKLLSNTPKNEEKQITPTAKATSGTKEEDTIKTFFQKINDAKADEAVLMMAPDIVNDSSTKQAWAVQFNAFKKVSIIKIEESLPENWTSTTHTYKVTLDVEMKPEAKNAVIPFYGYDNGENVRFVSIVKVSGVWKIQNIATGP